MRGIVIYIIGAALGVDAGCGGSVGTGDSSDSGADTPIGDTTGPSGLDSTESVASLDAAQRAALCDWMASLFGCNASNNKYNYCNKEFDAAAAKGDTGTDLPQRLQAYAQAQGILVSDLPVAPLYYRGRMVLVKPWVQNLVITPKDDYPGLSFLNAVSVSKH